MGLSTKNFRRQGVFRAGEGNIFIHILIYKCGLLEGFLLYLVCYDVGFILYGAQAVIWSFTRGAVGRADVSIGPYGGLQEAQWAGDRKGRPYAPFTDRIL